MNTLIPETIAASRAYALDQLVNMAQAEAIIEPLIPQLSASADINPYGTKMIWITVNNREDMAVCLTLASRWEKRPHGTSIAYVSKVAGREVWIIANDAALPPTCRVVEELVTIPATEERVEKKLVLKCDHAPENADIAAVETPEINPAEAVQ